MKMEQSFHNLFRRERRHQKWGRKVVSDDYSAGSETNPFQNAKVLIVEDNPDACALIAGILWLKGVECIKAQSVEESIDNAAEAERIDVAVLNGRLAQEKGGFLVARLKELKPKILLFVITNDDSDRARVMQLGCDEFSKKPISTESIADKVLALIAKGAATPSVGSVK
jgi:DNA-binding response OmpR family regulator